MKKSLCETCKNRFHIKFFALIDDYHNSFEGKEVESEKCIFRSSDEYWNIMNQRVIECTFYDKAIDRELFNKIQEIASSKIQNGTESYQDINRTYTTGERQLSNRFDCRSVQREAA